MIIKKWFKKFIEKIFFNRKKALLFCTIISVFSYFLESCLKINNLFSSSGAIFTIAGLFLNIKLTAHFHLKLPNGNDLGIDSKHAMITGRFSFGGNESQSEKEIIVREVESDEIWGATLMVVGTLIWGYGSYLII
ncbi:hypothetical protein [Janthinobacterium sp.]|uniref:hypothetical protein n=1 Tax=Janthinobacterium sp. TaxID=1871054 RepID=UPI00293D426A|nr:hypothetical protein [Janthinobacterium sp.]